MPTFPPAKTLRALIPALLVTLVLTACGGTAGDPTVAATVNGEDIPIATVEERLEVAKADPQVQQNLEGDDGTAERQIQAQILSQLIRSSLLEQGAVGLDVTVTDADVDARLQEIIDSPQFGGQEAFDAFIAERGLSQEDVNTQIRDLVYQEKVQEALTADIEIPQDRIDAAFAEQAAGGGNPRARHILVGTEEEAQDVLSRLEAGEDFGDLAAEVSTDPSAQENRGELGEIAPGQTVPEFEEALTAAAEGEVVGPVQTQFGFHVIERLAAPTQEEAEEQIREQLRSEEEAGVVEEWLLEQNAAAEVTVNPRLGAWDAETGQVTPVDPLGNLQEAPTEGGTEDLLPPPTEVAS